MAQVASTQGCDRDKLGDFCNDDLSHIGSRYGVSVKDLLWWNPDLYGTPPACLPACQSRCRVEEREAGEGERGRGICGRALVCV